MANLNPVISVILWLATLMLASPIFASHVSPQVGKTYWLLSSVQGWEYRDLQGELQINSGPLKIIDATSLYDHYRVEIRGKKVVEIRKAFLAKGFENHWIVDYDPVQMIKAKKWAPDIERAVIDGKILLGMTQEQVQLSWGKPERVNRSVGAWGVNEQWVYEGRAYLYFQNGKLTSWQDSR